jgi:hypothetical protein
MTFDFSKENSDVKDLVKPLEKDEPRQPLVPDSASTDER